MDDETITRNTNLDNEEEEEKEEEPDDESQYYLGKNFEECYGHDCRKEWVKERMMAYMGIEDPMFFNEMLAENNGEIDRKLGMYLDNVEEGTRTHNLANRVFYIYRTWSDRLFEEEIYVQELGMNLILILNK